MPVVDEIARDYADEVAFVAPAWKGTAEATAERAAELMPSGIIQWGLDAEETVFQAYGVPYQPVTVLISADGRVVESWPGMRSEGEIRSSLDALTG